MSFSKLSPTIRSFLKASYQTGSLWNWRFQIAFQILYCGCSLPRPCGLCSMLARGCVFLDSSKMSCIGGGGSAQPPTQDEIILLGGGGELPIYTPFGSPESMQIDKINKKQPSRILGCCFPNKQKTTMPWSLKAHL